MSLFEQIKKSLEEETECSSLHQAIKTVTAFHTYIENTPWNVASELLGALEPEVDKIEKIKEVPAVVKNMTYRVLKVIRDEYSSALGVSAAGNPKAALHRLFSVEQQDFTKEIPSLKDAILDNLSEVLRELESSVASIVDQAKLHLGPDETILTLGFSQTVVTFLKAAHANHPIRVLVIRDYRDDGAKTIAELTKEGINCTYIYSNSIYAVSESVSKVVLGALKILADGTVKTLNGCMDVVRAANFYKKPVFVCCGVHKLSLDSKAECLKEPSLDDPIKRLGPVRVEKIKKSLVLQTKTNFHFALYDYLEPEFISNFLLSSGFVEPHQVQILTSQLYYYPKGEDPGHIVDDLMLDDSSSSFSR